MSQLASSRRIGANPLQDFLLVGGSVLLVLGIVAFIQPSFFGMLSVHFMDVERMLLVILGATFLGIERHTERKVQEYTVMLAGALGLTAGLAGLMFHLQLIDDVLGIVNVSSMTNSLVFFFMGAWAITVSAISERH